MPENDIYNSKKKYEDFTKNIDFFVLPPEKRNIKYKMTNLKYQGNINSGHYNLKIF